MVRYRVGKIIGFRLKVIILILLSSFRLIVGTLHASYRFLLQVQSSHNRLCDDPFTGDSQLHFAALKEIHPDIFSFELLLVPWIGFADVEVQEAQGFYVFQFLQQSEHIALVWIGEVKERHSNLDANTLNTGSDGSGWGITPELWRIEAV